MVYEVPFSAIEKIFFQKKSFLFNHTENFTYLCSMISLSRHIELLLLEHDCVIVPGLGGFIANYAEAQYDNDGDSQFLPPYRTIRFNQQLQMNDGLLVQSYMAAYDASYPAAYLQMEKDIEKVIYELDTKGEVAFEKIGVLKKEINQSVAFTPSETCVLTPSLYGLYSYEIKSLNSVIKEKEVKEALNAASAMAVSTDRDSKAENGDNNKNSDGIIRLHRRWIDVGISVAAAVVLLFGVSYQALKNTASSTDTVVAAFYTTNDVEVVCPASERIAIKENKTVKPEGDKKETDTPVMVKPAEKPVENVVENVMKETAKKPVEKAVEPTPKAPEKQEQKFSIVLASFVNKTNADTFIENLSKQGFKNARYVKNGNVSRILYSNYKDKEEAQQALQELRQKCREFADAWILEL